MFKFVMTKNSNEIFHRAILSNDISRTKLILEEAMKDPRFNIDEINDEGLTALQFSCFAGNLDIVKILISYNSSFKIRDRDGNTLLHAAALAGTSEVLKYLIRVGLKPTIRNDDNQMPIDATEEICVIVILLRAMLDQGYLEEMQEYMLDHPKLKRNIFKELERVKCRENEKNEILKDLPYTSHTSPRRQPIRLEQIKSEGKSRSLSTFSKLSDSMHSLDHIALSHNDRSTDRNNNHRNSADYTYDNAPTLNRHNSTSSSSSHGSRSSRGSGGILRHGEEHESRHKSTQQYLESRFPSNSSLKSVTFDPDLDHPNHRNYSDGYISETYEDKIQMPRPLSRSSSVSSHSSSQVFSDTCSNFDFPQRPGEEEPLYANTQSLNNIKAAPLSTINENLYENLPLKSIVPPLPPRIPQHAPPGVPQIPPNEQQNIGNRNSYDYTGMDPNYPPYPIERQLGSETDSGIDINETTGRVFALSLDDQKEQYNNYHNTQSPVIEKEQASYSKPIGIFYSQQQLSTQLESEHELDNPGMFVRPINNASNPKYRSWNGRTLLESQMAHDPQVTPYSSHSNIRRNKKHSRDDYDAYSMNRQHENDSYNYQQQNPNGYYQRQPEIPLRQFNFDHQPEIML